MIVIVNASGGAVQSGRVDLSPESLLERFAKHGRTPAIHFVEHSQLRETVTNALRQQPDILAIGGGDGTLSSAVNQVVHTSTALGVLPLGTLNHFAKDLGIADDLDEAIATLVEGVTRTIDVGVVNDRYFINNCSIGAYPETVRRRDELRRLRGYRKWTAMLAAGMHVLLGLKRLRAQMRFGQQFIRRRTPMILVSNNRYSGGLFARRRRERLDSSELWVHTVRTHRFFPLLRLALLASADRLEEAEELEIWPVRELELSLPGSSVDAGVDGEVLSLPLPLRFGIRAGALRVVSPRQPSAT